MNKDFASTPSSKNFKIMIVAGEASGDKHGAALARAFVELYPDNKFEFFGSGGDEMQSSGVELLVDIKEIATIGVAEILAKLPGFYRAYRTVLNAARQRRPDAVVLIDWPDFNLRIAKKLHRERFNITYYIGPQVWAWRRHRINAIKRDVNQMLVILPFEKEFYESAGIPAEYVGHPLLKMVIKTETREEFCRRHGLELGRPIIAMLPGSRHSEVRHHLPLLINAAKKLAILGSKLTEQAPSSGVDAVSQSQDLLPASPQFVIPLASTIKREDVDKTISDDMPIDPKVDISIVEGDTYNAMFNSEFAIVASGTATVEAALAGTPMVIIYRGSELNWRLIRPLISLDTFGMVNLIAGRRIVPELIQHDATGENIAREVFSILSDPERLAAMRAGLSDVKELLRVEGSFGPERAASAVMRSLN